jgi:hypothetical protein
MNCNHAVIFGDEMYQWVDIGQMCQTFKKLQKMNPKINHLFNQQCIHFEFDLVSYPTARYVERSHISHDFSENISFIAHEC